MTFKFSHSEFEGWIEVRERIVERDFYMCQKCMSSHKLQVHHKYYINGRMAWDYQDDAFITLCDKCHKGHHELFKVKVRDYDDKIPSLFRSIKESVNAWINLKAHEDGKAIH